MSTSRKQRQSEKMVNFLRKLQSNGKASRRNRWLLAALVSTCFAGNGAESLMAQGRTDAIAQTGQTVPGGNGTISTLDNTFFPSVVMNDSGQVVFQANLAGTSGGTADDEGLYRGSGGALTQIAREGQSAPGGSTFGAGFGDPTINNVGDVAFGSTLSNNLNGLFRSRGGSNITQIARQGQTVPDGNGRYSNFEGLAFNDAGQVAWRGVLTNTSGGSTDNRGVFRGNGTSGSTIEIVRMGEAAPDGNGTFVDFNSIGLSSGGQVAFGAFLSPNSNSHRGIFRGAGGSVTQIARTGYAAPGGGTFDSFLRSTINDAGQVAFEASMTGTSNSSGIFRGNGETLIDSPLVQIVRRNQAAPDGNGSFSIMNIIGMNSSGQVGFTGLFSGTSGGENDNFGLYRGSGGAITQIAREGQSAPDGNGVISGFGRYELNNAGAMAFQGILNGTSGGTTDDRGLYVSDGTDLLQAIREGDSVLGSTVTGFRLADVGFFNNHGQVAYQATLANGNQVVQRWTPEIRWRSSTGGSWDTASRWTLGLTAAEVHDVFIDTPGSLTVTGPTTDRTVRSLRVGGNTGQATLDLRNGAVLTALNGATIANKGTLTGDGVIGGNVTNLAGGTVRANNVTITGTLTNHGVIRGNGQLDAAIVNQVGGSIRASNGDVMTLGGSELSNSGMIEVHQGELSVAARLNNDSSTGLISVRNGGTLRADGGLTNRGGLVMSSGMATIHGDIENGGIIQVSGGAHATFFGDLHQEGVMQVSSIGNTNSVAVLLGEFSGNGGFVGGGDVFALGDLRPGNSPASVLYDGNLFLGNSTMTEIELGGLGLGQFDQLVVSGDLNLAGDLIVSLIDGHTLGLNQQYLIGDVSGQLFGQFNGLSEGALVGNFGGTDLFISYSADGGRGITLFSAVPEPAAGMVLLIGLAGLCWRRRRLDAK